MDAPEGKYSICRELEYRENYGRKYLVEEQGAHGQYWPQIHILLPYEDEAMSLKFAKAAVAGWNMLEAGLLPDLQK